MLNCYDGPFESVVLSGCVDSCRAFETLAEAEQHCNSIVECGGISKTAYGDQEAINMGVGLYEVREGPGLEASRGDLTWIKQVNCDLMNEYHQNLQQDAKALDDLNHLVNQHKLTPVQTQQEYFPTHDGGNCFSYSDPVHNQYLQGCIDHCRSFQTLEEAINHCDTLEFCGGVTHSLYGEGQNWHQGTGPFEVRMGPTLKRSKDGDLSWIRVEHPCTAEDGMETGFETADWSQSMTETVKQADRSLMFSLMYIIGFMAFVGIAVYVSYKQGHAVTVSFVGRARDRVRQYLDRGNPEVGSGAYESL